MGTVGNTSNTTGRSATGSDTAHADGVPAGHDIAGTGTAAAWEALGGDAKLLDRVTVTHRPGLPASRLGVRQLARSTVAVCALAAAELAGARAPSGSPRAGRVPAVHVDDGAVATAFTSERNLLIDGRAPEGFAPLSRFWPTADGWVRAHANYPHHRAKLLAALGVRDTGDEETTAAAVGASLRERRSVDVEEPVFAAGGLAVAVREAAGWAEHPQGAMVSARPLLSLERMDQAPPLVLPDTGTDTDTGAPLHALDGVRVLDLTRVIAGPVATRTLAQLGADVLRLDPPDLPERPHAHADTGFGKRSAVLDLASRHGQETFEALLSSAHVVLTGYRPGALDRFGLAPESLADRRPGLVVGQLSAWGPYGPWRRRRGFDSLVQAASGIALHEKKPDGTPGTLPAQALDHGTGYLLAAAVLRALTEARRNRSGSRIIRVALTQTADWLLHGLPAPGDPQQAEDFPVHDPAPWTAWADSPLGRLRYALPPVAYEGAPTSWSRPPGRPGADSCAWT